MTTHIPTVLYHGTSLLALAGIAKVGLTPRGKTRPSKWNKAPSHEKSVYLTSAYGLYFAQNAVDDRRPRHDAAVVIEVMADALDPTLLHADEDAIEQALRGRDKLPKDWSMKQRTVYYRTRARRYPAAPSLATLGTCAYRGVIPTTALRRVAVLSLGTVHQFVLYGGIDPIISTTAFAAVGRKYLNFSDWLFNGTQSWFGVPRDDIQIMPFADAARLAGRMMLAARSART